MNRVLARIRRPRLLGATILTAVVLGAVAWGFHDPALAALDARIAHESCNARLYLERGELWRQRGRMARAEADYDRAARLDPALAAVDLARARWCADNGRLWLGVKLLDRFLAVESGHQEARALRARLYLQLGQPATLATR